MMTIDTSLFYLYEKVRNDRNSTENEITAINSMIEYVNNSKKESLKRNKLFSKLYAIYFGILSEHFKDVHFAQRQILEDLSMTLGHHIQQARLKINNLETLEFFKQNGISEKRDFEMSREDLLKENENAAIILKLKTTTPEQMTKAITIQITEAINKFEHYE